MNIIIVNYGYFNSNSGGHVAYFANALAAEGVKVAVVGQGDFSSLNDYGPVAFEPIQMPLEAKPLPNRLLEIARQPETLIHAWTPRQNVQRLVENVVEQTECPYIVHLEDHELMLVSSALNINMRDLLSMTDSEIDQAIPISLTHPTRMKKFLERSIGATLIVQRLAELCPVNLPTFVLEPGVDADLFCSDLPQPTIQALREELYIDQDAKVVVYNGNGHSANVNEIFSLYTAVLILRRRGHNIVLIRSGKDYFGNPDVSYQGLKGDWTIDLGVLDRQRMIQVLKLADFYVQPGPPSDFNAYRLPSKLPEFLALGKPLITPATNIGLRLRHGENALLLERGNAQEIAAKVEMLLKMEDQGRALGHSARNFAKTNLDWTNNAIGLLEFYKQRLRVHEEVSVH